MRFASIALIATVVSVQAANAQLVGVDITIPNRLVSIDPGTAAITVIGPTLAQSPMNGLAWDPNGNVLYGINPAAKALFRLNQYTGAATQISPLNTFNNVNGLAFDPVNNVLFASENTNNRLMRVSTSTGLPTSAIVIQGVQEVEGLAFDPFTQTLFGISDISNRVCRIDPVTGVATALPVPLADHVGWRGLEYDGLTKRLYATAGPLLYRIDPTSGAATLLGSAGNDVAIQGLAIIPTPATSTAFATCALAVLLRRRRR